jgi:putative nucleotidyltransferase with HDIG domain
MLLDLAPELEALPSVAHRVLSVLRDGRASADRLACLLETDQALAAAVLRHANSGRAMPNRRIASLREAVARIGQRTLSLVVVRACAGPMLDRGLPPYALPRRVAWRHAATTSAAARGLARLLSLADPDEAGVAGLLHDVGKVVLTSVVPEAAAEAVSIARGQRLAVWQAEQHVLGFDHGAVGGALLRRWRLPERLAHAVELHHRPEPAGEPLAMLVGLADAAAHAVGAVGSGGACPQPVWDPAVAAALGANPAIIEHFVDRLRCVDEGDL